MPNWLSSMYQTMDSKRKGRVWVLVTTWIKPEGRAKIVQSLLYISRFPIVSCVLLSKENRRGVEDHHTHDSPRWWGAVQYWQGDCPYHILWGSQKSLDGWQSLQWDKMLSANLIGSIGIPIFIGYIDSDKMVPCRFSSWNSKSSNKVYMLSVH